MKEKVDSMTHFWAVLTNHNKSQFGPATQDHKDAKFLNQDAKFIVKRKKKEKRK